MKDTNRMTVELQKVDVAPLSLYANGKPSGNGSGDNNGIRVVVYLDIQNVKDDSSHGAEYALFVYRDKWTLQKREAEKYALEVGTGDVEMVAAGDKYDITIRFDSSLIQGEIARC